MRNVFKIIIMKNWFLPLFIIMFLCTNLTYGSNQNTYSTGPLKEIDRCASAWLIKRFIDMDAEFKFYSASQFIDQGIAFDTPDASLQRTHQMSTFEVIAKQYKIENKYVKRLGKIIHEIEINFWSHSKKNEPLEINGKFLALIKNTRGNRSRLEVSFKFFDSLVEEWKSDEEVIKN